MWPVPCTLAVITAVLIADERGSSVYVPIRPICDFMGLNWDGQRRRINRDAVLSQEVMSVVVTTTDIDPSSRRPHTSAVLALPLKFIPGFLFGINADRVKSELRDKIIRYQRECYDVLAEAFREGRLTSDPDFSQLLILDTPAVQAYKASLAIVQLARQQVIIEAQLADHEQRLESIGATLSDSGRFINKEQAIKPLWLRPVSHRAALAGLGEERIGLTIACVPSIVYHFVYTK